MDEVSKQYSRCTRQSCKVKVDQNEYMQHVYVALTTSPVTSNDFYSEDDPWHSVPAIYSRS